MHWLCNTQYAYTEELRILHITRTIYYFYIKLMRNTYRRKAKNKERVWTSIMSKTNDNMTNLAVAIVVSPSWVLIPRPNLTPQQAIQPQTLQHTTL